jgi:hypothetical protein
MRIKDRHEVQMKRDQLKTLAGLPSEQSEENREEGKQDGAGS